MQPLINSALLAVFASSPLPRRVRARPLHLSGRASPSRHHPAKCDPHRSPAPPCACPSPTTHPPKCDPILSTSPPVRPLPRSPFVNLTMALLRLPSPVSPLASPVFRLSSPSCIFGRAQRHRPYIERVYPFCAFCAFELAIASCTPLVAKTRLPSPVSPLASPVSRLTSCASRLTSCV